MHDASRLHVSHRDPTAPIDPRRRRLALAVLCLCALTTGLDITITNLALPFISSELDASISELQWVVDVYNLVVAGLLVLGGALADRYGRRRVFLAGYTVFGLSCLLAAFSSSAAMLIAARAVMGIGAAAVIAPALAILAVLYPREDRAPAIAAWAVFGAAGLALGPITGGLLLDAFWWGSIFLVNVPIVAVGVVIGLRAIPESRAPRTGRLDVPGAVLSVLGLGGFLLGVIEGPDRGWTDPFVIAGLVLGAGLLLAFTRRELRIADPLFDIGILRRRPVAAGAATLFVAYAVFTGMLFLLPQWLQDVRRESIVAVGLLLVPFAVAFGTMSLQTARLVQRWGARRLVTGGLLVCAAGMALLGLVARGSAGPAVVASVVVGLGLAALIAPPSTVVMNALPPAQAGDGSSLNMVSRFVGAAIGVAVIGSVYATVFARQVGDAGYARAFDDGVRAGSWATALLALLGAGWAWWALRPETTDDQVNR